MSQKLAVLYNGIRKTVPVGPRTIVQDVIGQVALLYSIDSSVSAISLQHRHAVLNPAEVVCHIGIPNNATVEVVVTDRKSMTGGFTKLTLIGQEKISWTRSFPSSSSLRDVIDGIRSSEDLGGAYSAAASATEGIVGVTYMRRPFIGDSLDSTLLSSLGLTDQTAKMQLIFGEPVVIFDLSTQNTAVVAASEPSIEASPPIVSKPLDTNEKMDIIIPPSLEVEPKLIDTFTADRFMEQVLCEPPALPPFDIAPAKVASTCEMTLQFMLSNNFDAASSAAVLLLLKYIDNILKHPDERKFYKIPTTNKVYIEKLANMKGVQEFLCAAGFYNNEACSDAWTAFPETIGTGSSHWKVVRKSVVRAAEELGISMDLYSRTPPAPTAAATVPQQVHFDPFRAMIIKTAISDGGNTKFLSHNASSASEQFEPICLTATDKKLADIERRREQLEGRPENVDRNTQVLIPANMESESRLVLRQIDGADEVLSTTESMDTNDAAASRLDSKLLAQHLAAKQKASGETSEQPLTTSAIRQLEKAKKQLVYNTCVVRIRFPDKVTIQGTFHPRNSMCDVYNWLSSCLADNSAQFDLYMAPPKIMFSPSEASTLRDLGMVPAVSLFLSWKIAVGSAAVDSLLRPDLLLHHPSAPDNVSVAEGKAVPSRVSVVRPQLSFPLGTPLVPRTASVAVPSSSSDKNHGLNDDADQKKSTAGKKPKWFKL